MLSYEKFKELVTERLTELVKQDYPDIEIKENRVAGHNFVEETLLFSVSGTQKQVETAKEKRYRLDPRQRLLQVCRPELTLLSVLR